MNGWLLWFGVLLAVTLLVMGIAYVHRRRGDDMFMYDLESSAQDTSPYAAWRELDRLLIRH